MQVDHIFLLSTLSYFKQEVIKCSKLFSTFYQDNYNMFSQVPVYARNQPGLIRRLIIRHHRDNWRDLRFILFHSNSAFLFVMEIEKYLWITKSQLRVQQYVSQAYQTLQTIIKLINLYNLEKLKTARRANCFQKPPLKSVSILFKFVHPCFLLYLLISLLKFLVMFCAVFFYVSLNSMADSSVWILINFVTLQLFASVKFNVITFAIQAISSWYNSWFIVRVGFRQRFSETRMGIFFTSQPFFRKVCLSVCFTLVYFMSSFLNF